MPRASVNAATTANPGRRAKMRAAKRQSCQASSSQQRIAMVLLPRRTGARTPTRLVPLFLEVGAGNKRLGQILRILHDGRHHEPWIPVALDGKIEKLLQYGVAAI